MERKVEMEGEGKGREWEGEGKGEGRKGGGEGKGREGWREHPSFLPGLTPSMAAENLNGHAYNWARQSVNSELFTKVHISSL